MTTKFTTEKELDEFLAIVRPVKEERFIPKFTPSTYDSKGILAERTKEFKAGCEAYWKKSNFSLLDCSDELRKKSSAINSVVQWFPRELKNAHPDFLNNAEEISETLFWFYESVLPSSEIGLNKLHEWMKYYLKPSNDDRWFYKWLALKNKYSSIPKQYQTVDFFIECLISYPRKARLINNPWDLGFEKGVLFPLDFWKNNAFRIAHYNAQKKIGEFERDCDENGYAKYLVSFFSLDDTELGNQLLKSDKPLTLYLKAIGAEPIQSK